MAVCLSASHADVVLDPGLYELTADVQLPHLETSLRYATTRETHCLGTPEATTLFPILRHPAFVGCALVGGRPIDNHREYNLQCSNPGAATGVARVTVGRATVNAVLDIKMGGKNMTLSQRINGRRLGACDPAR